MKHILLLSYSILQIALVFAIASLVLGSVSGFCYSVFLLGFRFFGGST